MFKKTFATLKFVSTILQQKGRREKGADGKGDARGEDWEDEMEEYWHDEEVQKARTI